MAVEETESFDWNKFFLYFFFICFIFTMSVGAVAIFTYDANAPEKKPSGGGGHGMILPQDGQYAPHVQVNRTV